MAKLWLSGCHVCCLMSPKPLTLHMRAQSQTWRSLYFQEKLMFSCLLAQSGISMSKCLFFFFFAQSLKIMSLDTAFQETIISATDLRVEVWWCEVPFVLCQTTCNPGVHLSSSILGHRTLLRCGSLLHPSLENLCWEREMLQRMLWWHCLTIYPDTYFTILSIDKFRVCNHCPRKINV